MDTRAKGCLLDTRLDILVTTGFRGYPFSDKSMHWIYLPVYYIYVLFGVGRVPIGRFMWYIIQIILAIYIYLYTHVRIAERCRTHICLMVNPTLPLIPSLIFTLILVKFLQNNFCLCIGCVHSDSAPYEHI